MVGAPSMRTHADGKKVKKKKVRITMEVDMAWAKT